MSQEDSEMRVAQFVQRAFLCLLTFSGAGGINITFVLDKEFFVGDSMY